MSEERSVDEVLSTAEAAGLKLKSNTGPVQVLKFSPALNTVDYRLLELPSELQDALETGEKIVFRGDEQDEAVLCSQTATYEMKVVDSSNTMLLCPRLSTPGDESFRVESPQDTVEHQDICASVCSYYELRPCRPRLTKLKQMLKSTAYRGPEAEDDHVKLYSLDDLLSSVQASDNELLTALQHLGAFETTGKWRILDVQFEEAAFTSILNLLDEKMWSYKSVPLTECCAMLEELYPRFVIKHCLEMYGSKCPSEGGIGENYCLDALRVCQFYAEYLLREVDRFNFDEFVESWQQSVPSGMETTLEQLKGLALWDLDTRPPVIWHFPVRDLPEDPTARFARLFRTRSKWTLEEIEPFINDLGTEKTSANALLLKYARMSTDSSGRKVFNSKRPL